MLIIINRLFYVSLEYPGPDRCVKTFAFAIRNAFEKHSCGFVDSVFANMLSHNFFKWPDRPRDTEIKVNIYFISERLPTVPSSPYVL